jgi:hypothetical protein
MVDVFWCTCDVVRALTAFFHLIIHVHVHNAVTLSSSRFKTKTSRFMGMDLKLARFNMWMTW